MVSLLVKVACFVKKEQKLSAISNTAGQNYLLELRRSTFLLHSCFELITTVNNFTAQAPKNALKCVVSRVKKRAAQNASVNAS
jgi:hypothetical protein